MSSTAYAREYTVDVDLDSMSDVGQIQIPGLRTMQRLARTRVLIASDQPIVRYGLRALFADETDIDLVAEAENGHEAVRLARQLRPDVVAIDVFIPELDGIT